MTKPRWRYLAMTEEEKAAQFKGHTPPAHHLWWVICHQECMGYVYQIPMSRAGTQWKATGAQAAWVAYAKWGQVGNGQQSYFATKSAAGAGVVRCCLSFDPTLRHKLGVQDQWPYF